MRKLLVIAFVSGMAMACGDDPKLDTHEEKAVESQVSSDQKSMDSLEKAIQAQMDAIDADSMQPDSL